MIRHSKYANLPKVGPVALRLVIGKYVSQREPSYLNSTTM
jgi:hypothetical protein